MDSGKLLVVDDKANMRKVLVQTFTALGFSVDQAADGEKAISLLKSNRYQLVITDLKMPKRDGLDVLRAAKEVDPDTAVIVITAYGTIEGAVEAMGLGAADYITKPFKLDEIERKVEDALAAESPVTSEDVAQSVSDGLMDLVGRSPQIQKLRWVIEKVGPTDSSVLIVGETGTGKELVAKAIHLKSERKFGPYIALNCAALAPGVLESELFGHEKGAFTGAHQQKKGRFEIADGGTLFLDEVGEMDSSTQVRLLRVLQQGEFERVGGTKTMKVDVRIVAATNQDLKKGIAEGRFREDFYYRLNVISVHLPPLRDRTGDIEYLAAYFVDQICRKTGEETKQIDQGVMDALLAYSWPGNVRELENCLERSVILADGPLITLDDISPDILSGTPVAPQVSPATGDVQDGGSLTEVTEDIEKRMIAEALERNRWNRSRTAEELGIKRTTLQYKIKKYGLE